MENPSDIFTVSDRKRVTKEERELWDQTFAGPIGPTLEGPAVRIRSFGYICMLELGTIPAVVCERLRELDPDDTIGQYERNVRNAIRKRGRQGPATSSRGSASC